MYVLSQFPLIHHVSFMTFFPSHIPPHHVISYKGRGNRWVKAFFHYFFILCTCHRGNWFFPTVQIALALVLCLSCGGELKSICSWVIATSKPRTCYLVSCFLQPPVGSDVPLLAQVSVLLFKHTPCCALLLQHRPDLGDPRATSGTLRWSSPFHQSCGWGQDRQASSNPIPSKLVNPTPTSHRIHYTSELSLVNIFLLWPNAYGLENGWHV